MTKGEQPGPPQDIPVEVWLESQKTRRWVNGALVGVLAAAAAYEADQLVTGWIWNDDVEALLPLRECSHLCENPEWRVDNILLGSPGTGHKSGLPVARAVAGATGRNGREDAVTMYVKLSDKGVNPATYPALLGTLAGRCESVEIGGQSAGGLLTVDGLRRPKQQPGHLLRISKAGLIGTPFRMQNVRNSYVAQVLADVGRIYPGGITGSFAADVATEIKKDRRAFFGNMVGGLMKAGRRTMRGDSPWIEMSGLVVMDETDLWENPNDFDGVIDEDTQFTYVASDEDDVVDVNMAIEDWGNFVIDRGGKFDVEWSRPGTGHANVEVGSEKLKGWNL